MIIGDYFGEGYIRIGVPLTRRDKLEKVTKKFHDAFAQSFDHHEKEPSKRPKPSLSQPLQSLRPGWTQPSTAPTDAWD